MSAIVYKLLTTAEWAQARQDGVYTGSALDRTDGFIHFSTADQVAETAARYFVGAPPLTLLAVDPERVEAELRWEPSRGGALFPHLYADLPLAAVFAAGELPIEAAITADGLSAAVTDLVAHLSSSQA
ncbi:uncharacterized protein (DUF952 family) [Allocatelliglobosispora scoriae]|uniref:Uncharacterized protein (DUF952 family) n=1 Tax=Allocatelliglobosispora scoriae TaxID=643052 RepID=A0A841BLL9_9ACTN|nr:DUF952 domain-containing protein [Allocatelliglobosispora scoriae]MBB5868146.1 uncharacterized protein (DUF952 family) [Allocatelliglobosispora scoriae]